MRFYKGVQKPGFSEEAQSTAWSRESCGTEVHSVPDGLKIVLQFARGKRRVGFNRCRASG